MSHAGPELPPNAIHVIADLHTDAVTKIELYFVETDPAARYPV